jgi:hypothetical protein
VQIFNALYITETTKNRAQYCHEGYKAFGSAKVCWAETRLVLADEFRQGNVPLLLPIQPRTRAQRTPFFAS